ncbi:MAG: hypothetical protein JXA71_18305 [Chitinispirillaceae bacterium]|nr:hypothetical protein [Chitinispirillaceae bacterium]
MLSMIVCSRNDPAWTLHERNAGKTIDCPHEYIRLDNRGDGATGICAAYNRGVKQARGDILLFMHEDVFCMEPGWGRVLEAKFNADKGLGLVGVAGTQYLFADRMSWTAAGRPFLRGRVVHELDGGKTFVMTAFSLDKSDAEVVAVDGLFFAVRASLFDRIRFDETTFPGFHFYDLDLSMQVRETHRLIVTWDILVKHLSAGSPDEAWRSQGRNFLEKYRGRLPVSCTDLVPDPSKPPELGITIDLHGKASRDILC